MTRRAITALIVTCLISLPAWAGGDIYVATTGNDTTGNGSIGTPYATIAKAITAITDSNGGWNIILRSGTYNVTGITIGVADTGVDAGSDGVIDSTWNTMRSYPGEWAIIDGQNSCNNNTGSAIRNSGYDHAVGTVSSDFAQAWAFERLEITNASDNSTVASGLWWNGGPFIARYLYVHDCNVSGSSGLPTGIGGCSWRDATVEYNYCADNGATTIDGNIANSSQMSIHAAWEYNGGTVDTGWCMKNNTIRYNYLYTSRRTSGILVKGSERIEDTRDGSDSTYETWGDDIHHNIIIGGTGEGAGLRYMQDYVQVYKNIVAPYGSAERTAGICVKRLASAGVHNNILQPVVYNNTIVGGALGITNNWKYNEGDSSAWWCYNNVLDGQPGDWARCAISMNDEYDSLPAEYTYSTVDDVIDRNYFYRNTKASGKRIAIGWDQAGGSYFYTTAQYEAIASGVDLFNRDTQDEEDTLFVGTSGADRYRTRSAHNLNETGDTVGASGIGGDHPYLSGVTIPSYIGATDPLDDDWVAGVLSLATYTNLRDAVNGSDPSWIEGSGSSPSTPTITGVMTGSIR